ncbi:hypothetical protein B2G88_07315 [Natronolimnobius baerhuensis]|uniref:Uncharacterized protein n=2 Tax=Natronolimnobius baerhuensis TaxID=253108 RepID=A0A202EAA7_9EURY|nr:hypothetical protein B2G88_07315 [Natronolimnobius baerhuensis]
MHAPDTNTDADSETAPDDVTDEGSIALTHKPTLLSSGVALVAAVVATAVAGLASTTGLGFGAVGALAIGAGLATGGRTFVDVGAVAVFFGVVVAGLEATVVGPTVFGTIAVVLAWDLAHTAIDIGEQLGRETQTRRLEAVAIVSSLLVGLLAGAIGYAVFIAGAGGQPVAMVVLLLLAAALITIGLGKRRQQSGRQRSRHTERSRRH